MDDLRDRIKRVQEDVRSLSREVALVGGFAFGLQVRARTTYDVDFAVAVNGDAQAESLMRGLHERGYRIAQVL